MSAAVPSGRTCRARARRGVGEGDGAAVSNEPSVVLTAVKDADVLLFDLA